MSAKLQINQLGAWRNVLEFEHYPTTERIEEIIRAAMPLAMSMPRTKWRVAITGSGGVTCLHHFSAQEKYDFRTARQNTGTNHVPTTARGHVDHG